MTSDANIVIGIKGNLSGAPVIKRNLDEISKKGDKATGSVDKFDDSLKRTSKTADRAKIAFAGLIAGLSVREIIRAGDEFALLSSRVQNSTRSAEEFKNAMAGLRSVAAQTGTELRTAVEVFQRISFVRDEIKATSDEMVLFTANVQKLGVVSGASTQALNAGLTQLGQGLSSGVLRAEEMNSILENIPAVAVAIADELGVTTGQLRQMVIDGEVLSKDVFAAILNQTEQIEEKFGTMPLTAQRAFSRLRLEFDAFVGTVTGSSGALESFAKVMEFASDRVQEMRFVANLMIDSIAGLGEYFKVAFNNALYYFDQFYNKMVISLEKLPFIGEGTFSLRTDTYLRSFNTTGIQQGAAAGSTLAGGGLNAYTQDLFNQTFGDGGLSGVESSREISKNYAEIVGSIEDGEKANKKNNKEVKKTRDTVRQTKDAVEDVGDAFRRSLDSAIQNSGQGFDRLMGNMTGSFGRFLGSVASALRNPMSLNIVAGATGVGAGAGVGSILSGLGGSGGGGLGGSGSLLEGIGSIGSSLLNGGLYSSSLGNIGANIGSFFSGGELLSSSAFIGSQALGNLGYGAIGGFAANLLGLGGGIGGTIGGTLGSVAGGALGASAGTILGLAGGPVGAVVGSFLGTALGGLFGGSTPSGAVNTVGSLVDGQYAQNFLVSDEASDEAVSGISQVLNNTVNALNSFSEATGLQFGSAKPIRVTTSAKRDGGQIRAGVVGIDQAGEEENFGRGFGQDAEAAVRYLVNTVIQDATFTNASQNVQLALQNSRGQSLDDTISNIELAQLIDSFSEAKETVSPLTTALDALKSQFDDLIDRAKRLGLPINDLTDAYERQREAVINDALAPLQDFLDNQLLSNVSSTSPVERLSLARSAFDENLTAIQSGDLSNIGNLTSQASNLLSFGRDVFASSGSFASLEAYVRQSVANVATDIGSPEPLDAGVFGRELVLSNSEQTSILEQMALELRELREENRKLRKSMERVGNQLVIQT